MLNTNSVDHMVSLIDTGSPSKLKRVLSDRIWSLLGLIWSEVGLQPRRGPPPLAEAGVSPLVSHHPCTCIPSWTLNLALAAPASTPHPRPFHSPVLCSQLPGLFLGPRFISTPAGIPSCHSGPWSLSGMLHGNENAPRWCRNLFLSLSPGRLARCFVVLLWMRNAA